MLVQFRSDGPLRLFRQHDHALLSGELAANWCGVGRDSEALPFDLILATALHDLAWRELDRAPLYDPDRSAPFAFHGYPLGRKLEAYRRGLDELAALHPYGALLTSLHYTSFPVVAEESDFQRSERDRRDSLVEALDLGEESRARLDRHVAFLRLFDNLSIFICLTPPSASLDGQPAWVERCRHLETPDGDLIHLTWVSDDVLHADPFPFRLAIEVRLPYRELEGAPFESAEALKEAWATAPDRFWWVCVRSAPRLA